jgi:hypothetical protein
MTTDASDVITAAGGAAERERRIELGPGHRSRPDAVVQRSEDARLVGGLGGPGEARPPGEEHLRHEIEDELLGLFGGVHRREQPRDLAQRAELEGGIVEGGLTLEQDAAQLEDDGEPVRQRQRHLSKPRRDRRLSRDDDFGLAALEACDLDGLCEAPGRPHAGDDPRRGVDREPDLFGLEPADQRVTASLKELGVRSGEAARGGERARQGVERHGSGGGTHAAR